MEYLKKCIIYNAVIYVFLWDFEEQSSSMNEFFFHSLTHSANALGEPAFVPNKIYTSATFIADACLFVHGMIIFKPCNEGHIQSTNIRVLVVLLQS